jgi:hypothetical protein
MPAILSGQQPLKPAALFPAAEAKKEDLHSCVESLAAGWDVVRFFRYGSGGWLPQNHWD